MTYKLKMQFNRKKTSRALLTRESILVITKHSTTIIFLELKVDDIPDPPSVDKENDDLIHPQPPEYWKPAVAKKEKGEPVFGAIDNPG